MWLVFQGPVDRLRTGDFPDLDSSVPFCSLKVFPDFPGLSNLFGDFPIGPFLFLSLFEAPTRNIPERVHDTIRTAP